MVLRPCCTKRGRGGNSFACARGYIRLELKNECGRVEGEHAEAMSDGVCLEISLMSRSHQDGRIVDKIIRHRVSTVNFSQSAVHVLVPETAGWNLKDALYEGETTCALLLRSWEDMSV